MTQEALEREIREAGMARARRMMERNEEAGRADNNAYAQALYRRFLLPLAERIKTAQETRGGAGRRAAHVALLEPLDGATAAYLAVRTVLVSLMTHGHQSARSVGRGIGKSIQHELALSLFSVSNPELYWEVVHDLDRRHSKSTTHRYNTLVNSAKKDGVTVPDWGPTGREQLGMWMLEQLRDLLMVDITLEREKKETQYMVDLTPETRTLIQNIKNIVEVATPFHLPFIEQPKDWTAFNEGGYHTNAMRTLMPYCVNIARSNTEARDRYVQHPEYTATVRAAINKLQSVQWQVNREMLDAIKEVAKYVDTDEIVRQAEIPKPKRPDWLEDHHTKDTMTDDQKGEFVAWKKAVAEWHTDMKLRGTRWGRMTAALRVAEKFAPYPAIYFLYQADFRGRLYAITTGLTPQGSDLSKALLRFANGKPLDTPDAVRWFKINIANKFGVDKVPYDERVAWVDENAVHLSAMGSDPVSNRGWLDADCPLQFLACCQEFARWKADPVGFVSHIPVGLDGSCNGLQHFSAMLRDSIGGKAVNLVPGSKPNDIYGQVAEVCGDKLKSLDHAKLDEREVSLVAKWLAHGMNRSIVKRSVMTLPYGSTRFSSADYIVDDYLRHGKAPEFEKHEYRAAAGFLSFKVWDSIGEVVVAARSAMDWLQRSTGAILREGTGQQIEWTAPSGFRVMQVYDDVEIVRVSSHLLGGVRLKVGVTADSPAPKRHKNGMAPNFVHSMDAAHLALCTVACPEMDLAMIHDDYGTHAADAQTLFTRIRETFVRMYEENDPLADFRAEYPFLPAVPPRGDLDLRAVLDSPYFFG